MDTNELSEDGFVSAPQEPGKLSDVAYAKIAGSIASGEYAIGNKLPTENELAESFGVSRPIVREALARLRDDGLVTSRRGSGTYVRSAPVAPDRRMAPLSSIADMRKCLQFRISLEGEAAYHAALALDDDGRNSINVAIARLERDLHAEEVEVDDDFNFHLSIARATRNRFFSATLTSMRVPTMVGMKIVTNFSGVKAPERIGEIHAEHCAIVEAIFSRDGDAAREAMRGHLENAMARAFQGVPS